MKIKLLLFLSLINVLSVTAQNIAAGKNTEQSSVYASNVDKFGPANAVDGNQTGVVNEFTVTHTLNEENSWWRVDLGAVYDISSITVYNRTECCSVRITGAQVRVGLLNTNIPEDYSLAGTLVNSPSQTLSNVGLEGRYVFIHHVGKAILSLAEVEVYGTEVVTPSLSTSLWTANGTGINYTAGKVGVGMVPVVDSDYILGVTGNTEITGGLDVRTGEEADIFLSSGKEVKLVSDTNMDLFATDGLTIGSEGQLDISSFGLIKIAAAEGGTLNLYSGSNASLSAESKLNVYSDEIEMHGESGVSIESDKGMNIESNDTMAFSVREDGDITMNTGEGGDIILNADTDSVKLLGDNIDIRSESDTSIIGDGNIILSTNENISLSGDSGVSIGTSSEENISLNTNQVRIGATTAPSLGYKLAVGGKVVAEEIKIALQGTTEWPDYVFTKDYTLTPLTEVEKHIQENGHLKDIPSAAQVSKNGILLGQMNAKLLQKIEELTLYTIAQEKKIGKLEAVQLKNKELEARLAKIEALLVK